MYTSIPGESEETSFLMYLDAHLRSASLQMSAMSRPERWTVSSPNWSNSYLDSYFAYRLKISARVGASGSSNRMVMSVLEISAGSRSFFLFVAQITKTSPSDSNESIFLSKVDRILLVASCNPDSRLVARESISSMNRITLPIACDASKISAKRDSDSP